MVHIPVLQKEVLDYLDPKPNENFIDCTIGEGGHALAILEKNGPKGKVLGIEWDPELYKKLSESDTDRLKARLILVNENFANLKKIVEKHEFKPVQGILFDLGLSSWHLEESKKGFSFQKDEVLDMRYNPEIQTLTAEEIIKRWPGTEIERILKEYSQEQFAKRIAKEIVDARKVRPIKSTFQLVEIIKKAIPFRSQPGRIHFATRTFQSLRIAVNNELSNLEKVLPQALEVLEPGGRLAIISFHSLEDRIVKNFYRSRSPIESMKLPFISIFANARYLKILTKKPVRPSEEEIEINPRSRSAKLRAAIQSTKLFCARSST